MCEGKEKIKRFFFSYDTYTKEDKFRIISKKRFFGAITMGSCCIQSE